MRCRWWEGKVRKFKIGGTKKGIWPSSIFKAGEESPEDQEEEGKEAHWQEHKDIMDQRNQRQIIVSLLIVNRNPG